jgi:hypothetical protein
MGRDYETLVTIFKRLGAADPEGWAASEVNEGIPQLHRFLVLRGMWSSVVPDGETSWIDSRIEDARRRAGEPLSGVGAALERLRTAGADAHDITEVVRGMQYSTLFSIAHLLYDPTGAYDDDVEIADELEDVGWGLWSEDADGNPIEPIEGLHESALSMDPSGREMRPRSK